MTQEWIDQYNKKCAEFLGMYDYSIDNEFFEKGEAFCYPEKDKNPGCGFFYHLVFHSDWNWIHEVVEAINKTQNPRQGGDTTHSTLKREVQALLGKAAKEAVIQSIDQFIDWYNTQK